jgi:nitrate/nitrite-specific signal transduction histidine kinase
MTYNAYTETLEDQKEKEDELQTIKEQFNNMQSQLQTLITALGSIRDQTQINQTAQILYKSGILNSS